MACRLVGAKPLSEPNAGIFLIGPLGTNVSEILIEIPTFSLKKMRLKVLVGKWRPFCLGLNVLKRSVIERKIQNSQMRLLLRREQERSFHIKYIFTMTQLCKLSPFGWPIHQAVKIGAAPSCSQRKSPSLARSFNPSQNLFPIQSAKVFIYACKSRNWFVMV